MGENSKIAWTDHTFNPWWGCTKVSEACKHCYAEGAAARFGGIKLPHACKAKKRKLAGINGTGITVAAVQRLGRRLSVLQIRDKWPCLSVGDIAGALATKNKREAKVTTWSGWGVYWKSRVRHNLITVESKETGLAIVCSKGMCGAKVVRITDAKLKEVR
jgi:hypothetical protein